MQGSQMINLEVFPNLVTFQRFYFVYTAHAYLRCCSCRWKYSFACWRLLGLALHSAHTTQLSYTWHELTFKKHDMHIILRFVVTFTSSSWLNSLFPVLFVSTLAVASRWVILMRPTLPDLFSPMVMVPWPICCSGIVHFPLKGGIKQNLKFQVSKLQNWQKKRSKEAIPYINFTEPTYLSYCMFLKPLELWWYKNIIWSY